MLSRRVSSSYTGLRGFGVQCLHRFTRSQVFWKDLEVYPSAETKVRGQAHDEPRPWPSTTKSRDGHLFDPVASNRAAKPSYTTRHSMSIFLLRLHCSTVNHQYTDDSSSGLLSGQLVKLAFSHLQEPRGRELNPEL